MQCVNLRERFGRRYRITFDPAYDPKGRPRDKLDRWMMLIPCERGVIYPYGGHLLAADVEGRAITAKRLRELDCTTTIQAGDGFLAETFDAEEIDAVAEILKPRRRRQVSEAERRRLQTLSGQHGFKPHSHQPERSRPLVTRSEVVT